MRKYNISREEIEKNKGNVVMRKIKRIMANTRVNEIEQILVNLLCETLGGDADCENP